MSTDAPSIPSPKERTCYYYGLPSQPALIARSSTQRWFEPVGAEAYLVAKELMPVGLHKLVRVWEPNVSSRVENYLDSQEVEWTSIDPVRIGYTGSTSFPVTLWIGVAPGSLLAEKGLDVALRCHEILLDNGIDDVHVELRESSVHLHTKLYKTLPTILEPTAQAREPFATTLGLPICNANTPKVEGTGTLFFVDSNRPGKLFLLTARHALFHPDRGDNGDIHHGDPVVKVMLLGDDGFKRCTEAIRTEIHGKKVVLEQLQASKKFIDGLDVVKAEEATSEVLRLEQGAQKAITTLDDLLQEVLQDWSAPADRVIGHVVFSPPLGFGVGPDRCTEDWAVVEVYPSSVDKYNFTANCMDLGTSIPVHEFTSWMCPQPCNPPSFKYPGNHLIEFSGTFPVSELVSENQETLDRDGQQTPMVIKRGGASGLTVGRLNNLRSVTRHSFRGKKGQTSREVVIFPRSPRCAFSDPGDSGSAVIDGTGRVAGMLSGGAGTVAESDCSYITPISFIVRQLQQHGFNPNIFPTADDLQ